MFCSNCGKEIRQGANFCMHCGTPVGGLKDDLKDKVAETVLNSDTLKEESYGYDEYSNCENGVVSFPKMFQKFFSRAIKEYFSFDGMYSRLEYFYANVIIYAALFSIVVPCAAVPRLYLLIAVPLMVAFIWLQVSAYIKRLKDLNWTLWAMLIPSICGLFIKDSNLNYYNISLLVFVYYQICILFKRGAKFKKQSEGNDKNGTFFKIVHFIFIYFILIPCATVIILSVIMYIKI